MQVKELALVGLSCVFLGLLVVSVREYRAERYPKSWLVAAPLGATFVFAGVVPTGGVIRAVTFALAAGWLVVMAAGVNATRQREYEETLLRRMEHDPEMREKMLRTPFFAWRARKAIRDDAKRRAQNETAERARKSRPARKRRTRG